jgi:hypothetical protein
MNDDTIKHVQVGSQALYPNCYFAAHIAALACSFAPLGVVCWARLELLVDDEHEAVAAAKLWLQSAQIRTALPGNRGWWSDLLSSLLSWRYQADCERYTRGSDTMDVWFDSGCSWRYHLCNSFRSPSALFDDGRFCCHPCFDSGALQPRSVGVPADLVLEGSDQHRGWFQVALHDLCSLLRCQRFHQLLDLITLWLVHMCSLWCWPALRRRARLRTKPFSLVRTSVCPVKAPSSLLDQSRFVLSDGFTLDEHGRKMSKSEGNMIEPRHIING